VEVAEGVAQELAGRDAEGWVVEGEVVDGETENVDDVD
jgi:hypothetical protein